MTVAVDVMGGDYAPRELVAGAVEAASTGDVQVILVGDTSAVEAELAEHDTAGLPLSSVPSEGVILEVEQPALALRQKPRASILVSAGLVKEGQADSLVTMGSTGAAMAATVLIFGTMDGIERPALGGPILGLAPDTVIIDLGTNVDCRPSQLLSFAIIGSVFARQFLSAENPRVALLSIGAEEGKGNRQIRETTEILKQSGLNFVGNVEASDLPLKRADVVVCDGFVGNVVMKLSETLGAAIAEHLREKLKGRLPGNEVDQLSQEIFDLTNVAESVGGGPLFGVKGVAVVGHGRSRAGAVAKAIRMAKRVVDMDFVNALDQELERVREMIKP